MPSNYDEPGPLVALISGVAAAIPAARSALVAELPGAMPWNLLDDRLITEAQARGRVDDRLAHRMRRLIEHAALEGAEAVLLTCSMYSFLASDAARHVGIPVESPDDAMFGGAAGRGYGAILLVSSVEPALRDSTDRAIAIFAAHRATTDVVPVVAVSARAPSLAGNDAGVADAVIAAVEATGRSADAVLIANYSLAGAAGDVEERLGIPVLTGAPWAARALHGQLAGHAWLGGSPSTPAPRPQEVTP